MYVFNAPLLYRPGCAHATVVLLRLGKPLYYVKFCINENLCQVFQVTSTWRLGRVSDETSFVPNFNKNIGHVWLKGYNAPSCKRTRKRLPKFTRIFFIKSTWELWVTLKTKSLLAVFFFLILISKKRTGPASSRGHEVSNMGDQISILKWP